MTGRNEPGLDRAKIVEVALDLLDEVGLDRLSTRALAGRLGIKSPSLYWHFKDRDELVAAMAEAMLTDLVAGPVAGVDGEIADWLPGRARALRRALLARRDGARVHSGTTAFTAQLPVLDVQITALMVAGLSATDAIRALQAISRYTVGFVLEEQAHPSGPDRPDADAAEKDARWDPNDLPGLAAAREQWADYDSDAAFEYGLRALTVGILATVDQPAAASGGTTTGR